MIRSIKQIVECVNSVNVFSISTLPFAFMDVGRELFRATLHTLPTRCFYSLTSHPQMKSCNDYFWGFIRSRNLFTGTLIFVKLCMDVFLCAFHGALQRNYFYVMTLCEVIAKSDTSANGIEKKSVVCFTCIQLKQFFAVTDV